MKESYACGESLSDASAYDDAVGNLTTKADHNGQSILCVYDTLNRLATLTDSLTGQFTFGYDGLSRRTSLTRPNGVNTNYNYDSLSRLLSVLHQVGANTLDGAVYTYDNAGNRTAKANKLNNITEQYTYDPLYQLTQVVQGATTTESYSYDPVGNRLSSLGTSYNYNSSNELTSNSAASFTYDANGNSLTKSNAPGTTQYAWDFENRLTSVTLPGSGGTVTFKYDPFGRRIQKAFTQNSTTTVTNYLYDGNDLIEEVDASGNELARYAQGAGIDEPLAELRSGAAAFYEQDGPGSVTSLSGSTGALANAYAYDAFGNLTASTGALTNPLQYTGRDYDPETGLRYYRARYYDPSVGRFISEDPIQFVTGAPYFYASNSPMNFVDPFGLAPGDWWDPRTPGNFWNQMNPFNPNGSFSQGSTSIWDSLSGMATGNWKKVGDSYNNSFLGQTAPCHCKFHTAERASLAGAGTAATIAGGLIILDAAGISSIGETQIGWKGGEITFTRPGCKTPDFRINPFGDDDWPPHYHRRPGIGKHRPWEGW